MLSNDSDNPDFMQKTVEEMESLLRRYPDLDQTEVEQVLHFLRKGPVLAIGLLTGRDNIKPQLDRFRADHLTSLSLRPKDIMVVILMMLAVIASCWLAWDAGR